MRIPSTFTAAALAALALAPFAAAQDEPPTGPAAPPAEAPAEPDDAAEPETAPEPETKPLAIGEPAPEIAIDTWVNGEAFTLAEQKGNVVVVEFWATWCGPCRVSIPHINEIYKKHKDKGLKVVGVSTEDLETVKGFHAEQDAMTYHVAVDKDGQTSAHYMDAVGATGIPHAFVIDQKGNLAWHGHPMDRLEQVVEGLLAGTYDPVEAQRVAERVSKLEQELQAIYQSLASEEDLPKMLPPLDALIEADPTNEQHPELKARVLEATGRGSEIPAVWVSFGEKNAENATALVAASKRLTTPPDLLQRDVPAALRFSRKAVDLTESKDAEALASLARAEYAAGWPQKALATQTKATAASEGAEEHAALERFYRQITELDKGAVGGASGQ